MTIQILELQLHGITAADYLAWCVDPEPPALGDELEAVVLDADPVGDVVVATLTWTGSAPAPEPAAAAAGLAPHGTLHLVGELRGLDSSWPDRIARGDAAVAA